jgi:hypothetical protein
VRSLDDFLPAYEFATRHEVEVGVDPARADRALREVTFREVPLVRALLFARGRLRGHGAEAPATAVIDFRVRPGTLATETRVHVPDPVSRRKFVRYWRVVRPFSGLIRSQVLRAAKRRAEAA